MCKSDSSRDFSHFHHVVLRLLMDGCVLVTTRLQQIKKQCRQKDTNQSDSSCQRTVKYKKQYQDDNCNIAIDNGVDHVHGIHFHKRTVQRVPSTLNRLKMLHLDFEFLWNNRNRLCSSR